MNLKIHQTKFFRIQIYFGKCPLYLLTGYSMGAPNIDVKISVFSVSLLNFKLILTTVIHSNTIYKSCF